MEKDPPKGTVPVWLSTHDDYGKSCEELKKMTPLEAFLAVSTLQYEAPKYEIKVTGRGIEVREEL